MDGYYFFKVYQAMYVHFSSESYDLLKFKEKGAANTVEIYEKRRDKARFVYFGSKFYNTKDMFDFCLANFLNNKDDWIYQSYDDCKPYYTEWVKHMTRLRENLKRDHTLLSNLKEEKGLKISDFFKRTNAGKNPPLMQMWLLGKVSSEFMVMLDNHFDFLDDWSVVFANDPMLSKRVLKLRKYRRVFNKLKKEYL